MSQLLLSQLSRLGLTQNEAAVYIALLEIGASNAGPVVSKTGLHRQLVYEAMRSLRARGLVSEMVRRNRKLFQASDPARFLQEIDEQRSVAVELIPLLSKLQSTEDESVEVKVLYGSEELRRNVFLAADVAAKRGKILRIIGGAPDTLFYSAVGNRYAEYLAQVKRTKVAKHLIAPANASKEFRQRFAAEPRSQLRTLEFGLSSPTYTRIAEGFVSIEIYAPEAIVIQIFSRAVAQAYFEHFQLLWDQAIPAT
jgi:sugar-specific transcriptional regulator TrmB